MITEFSIKTSHELIHHPAIPHSAHHQTPFIFFQHLIPTMMVMYQPVVIFSTHQGYADDMIQDISDVIIWTQKHVGQYGGNPVSAHIYPSILFMFTP